MVVVGRGREVAWSLDWFNLGISIIVTHWYSWTAWVQSFIKISFFFCQTRKQVWRTITRCNLAECIFVLLSSITIFFSCQHLLKRTQEDEQISSVNVIHNIHGLDNYLRQKHWMRFCFWIKYDLDGSTRHSSLAWPGFELITPWSRQNISCHWDACSNHLTISDFCLPVWIWL